MKATSSLRLYSYAGNHKDVFWLGSLVVLAKAGLLLKVTITKDSPEACMQEYLRLNHDDLLTGGTNQTGNGNSEKRWSTRR